MQPFFFFTSIKLKINKSNRFRRNKHNWDIMELTELVTQMKPDFEIRTLISQSMKTLDMCFEHISLQLLTVNKRDFLPKREF